MNFEAEVTKLLSKHGIKEPKLSVPARSEFGDLSLACFDLAKKQNNNPVVFAIELAKKLKPSGLISKIIAVGPYVNFFVDMEKFSTETVNDASNEKFGGHFVKGNALIEHTSINPNASPHVGRARNALIGDSLVRVLNFAGYDVDVHYFVNDIGKQIAMLVYVIKDLKKKVSFDEMLQKYIEINGRVLENVTLEKEIFKLLNKLEHGDRKTKKLFEKVVSTCVKGQTDIFAELGIKYDSFDYESRYIGSKLLKDTVKKLKKRTFKDEHGRFVLDLKEFNLPMKESVMVLTREDGTSLYPLRDLAYNLEKIKWSKGGKNIVVLGEDHKLEYLQIKAALSILKKEAPEVVHYAFILLPEGKMSTRSGKIVLLTEFMKEAIEKAKIEIRKRHPNIEDKRIEQLAKIIGYGALRYSILKISAEKNVIFSWDEALNFEGSSAPYIQYTYVRAKRIIELTKKVKSARLIFTSPDEFSLIKEIARFPNIVRDCVRSYRVHSLAKYAYELAFTFNMFYEKCRVSDEPNNDIKMSRLKLVNAYTKIIKKVLYLLGIDTPEFM